MKKSQFNPATYILELDNSLTIIITEITAKLLFSGEIYKNWDEIIQWQKRRLVVIRRILNTDWGSFANTAIASKIIRRAEQEFEQMKRSKLDTFERLQECKIYRPDGDFLDQPVMVNEERAPYATAQIPMSSWFDEKSASINDCIDYICHTDSERQPIEVKYMDNQSPENYGVFDIYDLNELTSFIQGIWDGHYCEIEIILPK